MLSPLELLNWLGQYQFLSPPQLDELRPLLPTFPDCHTLAKELIRRDWLTPFQVNQILQGNHAQLVLGNYRLRERIGEGAMGQVFKAWNLRMARVVAVKTVHKQLVNSSKAMERFRRELETAAQLNHPNIALVRDADEVEGRPFLVMDFIEGFNLTQRVKQQGALPIHEAAEYTRQAALGLQHALERGIVHRDIKPGNLIVTPSKGNGDALGVVKILDFGLARYESERENSARLTQVGNLLGTIDYIAPEQAQNASTADIRADIYSLGCTLFYLLTGQPPFAGDSVVEKIGPRLTGEPPSVRSVRPDVPLALDEVLRKLMARLPAQRFQTPIEVAQALQPFTVKQPLAPPPPGVILAQPVAANAVASGTVLMAQPIMAAPVATAVRADPPFFMAEEDEPTDTPPADEEPSFLTMTSSGRALSTDGATPTPAMARPKKPFPKMLVLGLGGAAFLLCSTLSLGICLFSSWFSGSPDKPQKLSTGSLRITEAKFSVPSQTIIPGQTKFVIIRIQRIDFKGPVRLSLKDLPEDVQSEAKLISDKANEGDVRFTVGTLAEPLVRPIRVVAESEDEAVHAEMTLLLKIVPDPRK